MKTIISQASDGVGAVALQPDYLYIPGQFSNHSGVQRWTKDAAPSGVSLASTALDQYALPDRAVVAGSDVYFVDATFGNVYKVAASGGAVSYQPIASGYDFLGLRALAADADAVYVLGRRGNSVVVDRIPLAGGSAQTLAQLPQGQWRMFVGSSDVFVSGGPVTGTALLRVPKTGGAPETVLPNAQCLAGLAVTADWVYCAGTTGLDRRPRSGGAGTSLYATASAYDIVQDVAFNADATVAYVSDDKGDGIGPDGNTDKAVITRVDTVTGAKKILACGLAPPHDFALNGSELAWMTIHANVGSKVNVQLLHLP